MSPPKYCLYLICCTLLLAAEPAQAKPPKGETLGKSKAIGNCGSPNCSKPKPLTKTEPKVKPSGGLLVR